jgi:hypothetical protein
LVEVLFFRMECNWVTVVMWLPSADGMVAMKALRPSDFVLALNEVGDVWR